MQKNVFELQDGEVRVWIEQETIHIIAGDLQYGDPTELTANMARKLATELERIASLLDE